MKKISIITPSYNMLEYLKRCAASIDPVSGPTIPVQHIVMDGNSSDGTAEWLAAKPYAHMHGVSEPDNGMYNAINKGLKIADGDILAYLNCDEQYLPGTLDYVAAYFEAHPEIDLIFGDALLTRPDGSLIAFRKGYQPRWQFILSSHLYVLSCTMFFRRRIIEDGFFFDTTFRAVGDADFVVRLLQHGYKTKHIKRYFSAFTMTGNNLSTDEKAIKELNELILKAPSYVRIIKPLLNGLRLTEKLLSGAYFQGGVIDYEIFPMTESQPKENPQRKKFSVTKASSRWKFE